MTELLDNARPSHGFPALERIEFDVDGGDCASRVLELLRTSDLTSACISHWLRHLKPADLDTMTVRSVERASHIKWYLGSCSNGSIVWLHQYKQFALPDKLGSFAASIHNHRYSFGSRVLSGSLTVSHFEFGAFLQQKGTEAMRTGTAYWLDADQIHRIDGTDSNTCTIVVQAPPRRAFSRVFHPSGRSFDDIYDLESRLPGLIDFLSGSAN